MVAIASQITSITIVYSTVYSDGTQILVPPVYINATSQVSNHWLQAMFAWHWASGSCLCLHLKINKQRVLMHGHQGWNVRHGLSHIYMIYVYIWIVYSFCLFWCLFIIVTTQFVALYKPCKPKPKPSTYDPPETTPWQRSKDRNLDRSQSNKYAIYLQIQTISVSK